LIKIGKIVAGKSQHIRASEEVQEKLEKSAIFFQSSAIFAKKCEKLNFGPKV